MCVADEWLFFKGGSGDAPKLTCAELYATLAEKLIENRFNENGLRDRKASSAEDGSDGNVSPTSGNEEHLTPTENICQSPVRYTRKECSEVV